MALVENWGRTEAAVMAACQKYELPEPDGMLELTALDFFLLGTNKLLHKPEILVPMSKDLLKPMTNYILT